MPKLMGGDQMNFSPKYIVEKVGAYYQVRKDHSVGFKSFSSLEVAVNDEAFNGLTAGRTAQEKVLLKGDLTLDAILQIPSYIYLELIGKITLAAAANCTMLENQNRASSFDRHITIDGGYWFANNNLQGAGTWHGIRMGVTGGVPNEFITIKNLKVMAAKANGLHIWSSWGTKLRNIWVAGDGGASCLNAIYLLGCGDGRFHNLTMNSSNENFILAGCGGNTIDNIYCGGTTSAATTQGQFYMFDCEQNLINNVRVDHSGCHGFQLDGGVGQESSWNLIHNLHVSDNQGAANTYDAIRLTGFCNYNRFSASLCGNGNSWKYGVNEIANCDYNVFNLGAYSNCATATTLLTGVNSKFRDQY